MVRKKRAALQGWLRGGRIPGWKIINHRRKKHVEESAANLLAPVGARTARRAPLGNHLATIRALRQMHGDSLTAVDAPSLVTGLICSSGHPSSEHHSMPGWAETAGSSRALVTKRKSPIGND